MGDGGQGRWRGVGVNLCKPEIIGPHTEKISLIVITIKGQKINLYVNIPNLILVCLVVTQVFG